MGDRLSGCHCCFECRSLFYPSDFSAGWIGFELNEGVATASAFPQPLTTGQRLRPPPNVLLSTAQAWYHRIRFTGDIDIQWDGLTIEVRPSAGTLTSAGETIPIMPPVLSPSNLATLSLQIMLVVTPDWYGVFFYNVHQFPAGSALFTSSRGAIQVVDRMNDPAIRPVTLTSQSEDAAVTWWRVADMSVQISGDEVAEYCPQPDLPHGTERFYQLQTAGSNTYSGFRVPQTFTVLSTSPSYVNLFGPGGPFDWDWLDYMFLAAATGGPIENIGPMHVGYPFSASQVQVVGGTTPYPFAPTTTIVQATMQTAWKLPTVENPYPKPEARHSLVMYDSSNTTINVSDVAYVDFDATGRAPATLSQTQGISLQWESV